MKNKIEKSLLFIFIIFISLSIFNIFGNIAYAGTLNGFTYSISNIVGGNATIESYVGPDGRVAIPSMIEGCPVKYIKSEAFGDRRGITSLIIPSSVTNIGAYAFRNCTGLTSISFPDSVTSLDIGALSGCSGLTSVALSNNIAKITDSVFYLCTLLNNVNIPNSAKSIDAKAFYGCSSLTNITIPESVIKIGNSAFVGCSQLTSIAIPKSVTSIGESALSGMTNLTQIIVDDTNPTFTSKNGVLFNKLGTCIIQYPTGKSGKYTMPNNVIDIGSGSFNGCTLLSEVLFSDTVISIGASSFGGCTTLNNVTIPSSVTSIGNYAFYGCTQLDNVLFLGNAPIMGASVFANCSSKFKIYYMSEGIGFTNPWNGYATELYNNSTPLPTLTSTPTQTPIATPSEIFVTSPPPITPTPCPVIDIESVSWAKMQIESLVIRGVISGKGRTSDGIVFEPYSQITRAEFTKLIVKAFDIQGNGSDANFSDVKQTDWFYDVVGAAFKNEIIKGRGEDIFEPQSPITRKDICVIIIRAMCKYQGKEIVASDTINKNLATFSDSDQISEYAKPYVATAFELEIVNGIVEGDIKYFKPNDNASRAQAAVMIYRMLENILTQVG